MTVTTVDLSDNQRKFTRLLCKQSKVNNRDKRMLDKRLFSMMYKIVYISIKKRQV